MNGNALQADEERYHSHLQTIERLASALKTAVDEKNASGTLLQEEFTAVLMRFFSLKHSESVERLVQAAVTELNVSSDDPLLYENLFTEVRCAVITFWVSRRRRKMYCDHARLFVCLSAAVCPHYCTDPDVTWGRGRGCP